MSEISTSVKNMPQGDSPAQNRIYHGDNLDILRSLDRSEAGSYQCAYLDPPYNNGERYNHYEDRLDHQTWSDRLRSVLTAVKPLLAPTGSLWISIDDTELHYLKVIADEVYGRGSFIATIVWEHRTTRENRSVFSRNHEYLLVYAVNPVLFKKHRGQLPLPNSIRERYRNPDDDPNGPWQSVSANVQDGHATKSQYYEIVAPNGRIHTPPNGRCWVYSEGKMREEIRENRIWFGQDGDGAPRLKHYLKDRKSGLTPPTLWKSDFAGTTNQAKKHLLQLFPGDTVFDTPKPERLLHKILMIATRPGDRLIDPYLGSGTSAAVAHKMQRHYTGIESNPEMISAAENRLSQVVNGESGGISPELSWTGGGEFAVVRSDTRPQSLGSAVV